MGDERVHVQFAISSRLCGVKKKKSPLNFLTRMCWFRSVCQQDVGRPTSGTWFHK